MKHFKHISDVAQYAIKRCCDVEINDDVLTFSPVAIRASGPSIACLCGWDDTGAILEGVYMFDADGELHEFPWSAIPDAIVKDFEQQYAEDCAERAAAYVAGKGEWLYEQARDRAEDAA